MDIERTSGPRGAMLAIVRGTKLPPICLMCGAKKEVELVDFGVRSPKGVRSELLPLCKTCIGVQSQSATTVTVSRIVLLIAGIGLILRGWDEMTGALGLSTGAEMAVLVLTIGAGLFAMFARATSRTLTPRYDHDDRVLVDVPSAVADAVAAQGGQAPAPSKPKKRKNA